MSAIARWQTTGHDYLELYRDPSGYVYRGRGQGGVMPLPPTASEDEAIAWMESHAVAVLKSDRPSLRRIV